MEDEVRRGYRAIWAVNPTGGRPWSVYVPYETLEKVAKGPLRGMRELAFLVPQVLQRPRAVLRATLGEEEGELLCYVGVPGFAFTADGSRSPPFRKEVFLVLVGKDHVVYNWWWRPCSPNDPEIPLDPRIRFHGRLI